MGYFYESGFCFGLARRAKQNTKDEIKYPTTVLTKPSYKRFIIQLEGYKISSVKVGPLHNENALHTNGTPLQVHFRFVQRYCSLVGSENLSNRFTYEIICSGFRRSFEVFQSFAGKTKVE